MMTEQNNPEWTDYEYYPDYSGPPGQIPFASRMQLFAVIVYLITQGFTIPILPVGPSWAVWPKLDDFATLFLLLVYLFTRHNTCPMNKAERVVFVLVVVGIIASFPSMFIGKLMRPEIVKGPSYGIFQTSRVLEYSTVWFCIRGMTFSSRQFDKISYTVFLVMVFVVIIALGNATGTIPPARLLTHLPYEGPLGILKLEATGAYRPLSPMGEANPGYLIVQMAFFTAVLLASRKPSLAFRIPLIIAVLYVVFLTGARAATVGWFVFLAIWVHKSPKQLVVLLAVLALLFVSLNIFAESFDIDILERATQRFGTIFHRETAEEKTLAGRTIQWAETWKYIISDPRILLVGVGWGYGGVVVPTGIGNAHCMYLQALLELGILGAVLFFWLLFRGYRLLRGKDRLLAAIRAVFLGLLVSSLTGEVFFPIASMGSFLGLVGAVFAIGTATCRGRLLEEHYYSEFEQPQEEDIAYDYLAAERTY